MIGYKAFKLYKGSMVGAYVSNIGILDTYEFNVPYDLYDPNEEIQSKYHWCSSLSIIKKELNKRNNIINYNRSGTYIICKIKVNNNIDTYQKNDCVSTDMIILDEVFRITI